ncbi:hypothetical protein NKJ04_17415 [Mesorhizobium sp. M0618]|uniref:hypothetical protein n=1 Tax=Mesorhizobium sp. M0618 TaxID=2956972 RepID=UPI00333CC3D1
MLKYLTFSLAMLAILTSFSFPVQAKVATWEQVGNWSVFGSTNSNSCYATVEYHSGRTLMIAFSKDMTSFMIMGLQVNPGQTYKAVVTASTGAAGVMEAFAGDAQSVAFMDVNQETIKALANSRDIYIQGLGTFELTGSKRAMASAWHCYEALNSI